MIIIYILAFVAIVYIIVHYTRNYYFKHEKDSRSEEEKAREEVESMIVHEKIEPKDSQKDEKKDK